jgi:branched-chain amino acid transport system substrate-binding protein
MTLKIALAWAVAGLMLSMPAHAQSKLKIGVIVSLSGPSATTGEQIRNGVTMAVDQLGRVGGLETEIIVIDDEQKPDVAANKARQLVERDRVDFVVGPIFSIVLGAIRKPVIDSGAILISPNAGPATYAGAQCHPNFYVTSYQNDQMFEVMGVYAEKQGYKNVFVVVPNYQAGKDAVAGFRRSYKGAFAGELYPALGQLDFAAELAQIAAFQPDAIFTFMPGGMGINFVKQFNQAGLTNIPFLSALTVDEVNLVAQRDAALGSQAGSNWAPDLPLPHNQKFVQAYVERFKSVPATYAMQGYDTVLLIDSAVRKINGDLTNKSGLRSALEAADFQSLRGDFRFGPNHYPIQDFYLTTVKKRDDGLYQTSIVEKIFKDNQDVYAAQCQMK